MSDYVPKNSKGQVLIMKRSECLCPNCMKKKVIQETEHEAYCDQCAQRYNIIGPMSDNSLTYQ